MPSSSQRLQRPGFALDYLRQGLQGSSAPDHLHGCDCRNAANKKSVRQTTRLHQVSVGCWSYGR